MKAPKTKTFIFLGIAIMLAVMAGWLTFSQSDDKATISIETKKVKEDTHDAVEAGKKLLEKAKEIGKDQSEEVPSNPSPSASDRDSS